MNKTITFQFTPDSQALGAHTIDHRAGASSAESKTFFNSNLLNVSDLVGRYIPEKVRIPKIGEVWAIYLEKKQPEK